jgi:hemoglobin
MTNAIVDEAALERLVPAFYARVREDPMLGPIFNGAVEDWPHHLDKLQSFWSSVMLGSGRYKGQPMHAHIRHMDKITPTAFRRWLAIWQATTGELLEPVAAAAMQEKATRIAESLSLGIEFQRDRDAMLPQIRKNNPEEEKTA